MLKCLLLINPRSRSGGDVQSKVQRLFEQPGVELVGRKVHAPEDLAELLDSSVGRDADRIIIGGGDGTLNACLPALMRAQIPVAVLPLGTANDFAHNLGIPSDLDGATTIALTGQERRIDVGCVNGRAFLNVATIGLGPEVTRHLTSELKARLGFLSYPRALMSAYREARPFRVRLEAEEQHAMRLRCIHLAIGNGRYYGGGAIVNHPARVDDGLLHLSALRPRPLWRLLLQAPLFGFGWHRPAPDAVAIVSRELVVETDPPKHISADGEIMSNTPATFELRPQALSILVPRINRGAGIRGV